MMNEILNVSRFVSLYFLAKEMYICLLSKNNASNSVLFQFASLETPGYVGFANLPNQVHRKSVKKGFEFTLMVVGESGLGKSTLVNSLFLTDLYPERIIPDAVGRSKQILYFESISDV